MTGIYFIPLVCVRDGIFNIFGGKNSRGYPLKFSPENLPGETLCNSRQKSWYTAVSRKIVLQKRKSERDNVESYYG